MVDHSTSSGTIESLFGEDVPTLSKQTGSGDFYLPASHVQLLEQLEHLSRYSHFIQVISGVAGIGKSTLLHQFHPGTSDNSVHACCINAQPGSNCHSLLAELVAQLNLDRDTSTSPSGQLQQLIEHCDLLKQISKQLLIVIDDAEHLSVDALELLLNQLSTLPDDEMRPHIVLFATPAIRQQLAAPQFSDVVESSCHFVEMQPLTAEEVNGLLQHSFRAVAARLNEQQLQRIYADSLGLPGRIPRALRALMSAGSPSSNPTTDATKPSAEPTTPAPSLTTEVLSSQAVADNVYDLDTLDAAIPGAMLPESVPASEASKAPKTRYWMLASVVVLLVIGAGVWQALPTLMEYSQSSFTEMAVSPAGEEPTTNTIQDPANNERIRLKLDIEAKPTIASTEPPVTAAATDFEQRLAQARAALDAEQAAAQVPPEPAAAAPTEPATTQTSQQLTAATVKTPPSSPGDEPAAIDVSSTLVLKLPPSLPSDSVQNTAQPENSEQAQNIAPVYYGDGKTLLSWKPADYSLQMLGAREEKNIVEFIASMPDKDNLHYFFTHYKDKPWYVVIYGRYASRAEAMTARGELPEPLRSKRPWARSVKGIQGDIRKVVK
ncbi:MAG: AAA family ATPase [Motiliproteus sp.]